MITQHTHRFSGTEQIAQNLPKHNGELLATAAFEVGNKPEAVKATVTGIDQKNYEQKGTLSFKAELNGGSYLRAAQAKGAFSLTETDLELGVALQKSGSLHQVAKAVGQSVRQSTPSKCAAFASPLDGPTMGFLFHASTGKTAPVVLERQNSYAQHPRLAGPDKAPIVLATDGGNTLLRTTADRATSSHRWESIAKAPGKIVMISLPRRDGKVAITYRTGNRLVSRMVNPMANGQAVIAGKPQTANGVVIRAEDNWKATFAQGKNPREINVTIQRSACSFQPKAEQPQKAAKAQKPAQPKADRPAQNVPTL